jgi:flavin-dependent dehydrogenase
MRRRPHLKTVRRLRFPMAPVVRQWCTELVLGKRLDQSIRLSGRGPLCAMTVRAELDELCRQRAVEAGAEFRVIRLIHAVTEAGGEVVLETSAGTLRTGHLIGADGAKTSPF